MGEFLRVVSPFASGPVRYYTCDARKKSGRIYEPEIIVEKETEKRCQALADDDGEDELSSYSDFASGF